MFIQYHRKLLSVNRLKAILKAFHRNFINLYFGAAAILIVTQFIESHPGSRLTFWQPTVTDSEIRISEVWGNKNERPCDRSFCCSNDDELDVVDEVRENIADGGAEQRQNDDNNDGDQNQDQSIFDETLTFFAGHVQHVERTPKMIAYE